MDDVRLALNHKDKVNAVTDIYVETSWEIIDEVQAAVLNLLKVNDGKAIEVVSKLNMEVRVH